MPEARAPEDTQGHDALAREARNRAPSAGATRLTSFRLRTRRRSRAGAHAHRSGARAPASVHAPADPPARRSGAGHRARDPEPTESIAPDDWLSVDVLAPDDPSFTAGRDHPVDKADDAATAPGPLAVATPRWTNRLAGAVGDRIPLTLRAARWSLDGRSVVVLVVVAALAVTLALLLFGRSPRSETVVTPTLTAPAGVPSPPSAAESDGPPATAPTSLIVHVAGFVARPGVYEVPPGARVVDALDAAGGAIEGTDLSQLNLARVLVDGEQVAVGVPAAPVPPGVAGPGAAPTSGSTPIDLNTATESDLDTLPGVGPVLAARIVAWRDENGSFSSVDELLEVSGIGESTLADLAPLVRV